MRVNPSSPFQHLHERLVEEIRARVRNGELTERSFARSSGVSQPHLHHVLKGTRMFSAEFADLAMRQLGISILDLCDVSQNVASSDLGRREIPLTRSIPILRARIGSSFILASFAEYREYYPFSISLLQNIQQPEAARLDRDLEMSPRFQENDLVLIDQGLECRTHPNDDSFYVADTERGARVRYIRMVGRSLFLASDATLADPAAWTRISGHRDILETVRARIVWMGRELGTPATPGSPKKTSGSRRPAGVEG